MRMLMALFLCYSSLKMQTECSHETLPSTGKYKRRQNPERHLKIEILLQLVVCVCKDAAFENIRSRSLPLIFVTPAIYDFGVSMKSCCKNCVVSFRDVDKNGRCLSFASQWNRHSTRPGKKPTCPSGISRHKSLTNQGKEFARLLCHIRLIRTKWGKIESMAVLISSILVHSQTVTKLTEDLLLFRAFWRLPRKIKLPAYRLLP